MSITNLSDETEIISKVINNEEINNEEIEETNEIKTSTKNNVEDNDVPPTPPPTPQPEQEDVIDIQLPIEDKYESKENIKELAVPETLPEALLETSPEVSPATPSTVIPKKSYKIIETIQEEESRKQIENEINEIIVDLINEVIEEVERKVLIKESEISGEDDDSETRNFINSLILQSILPGIDLLEKRSIVRSILSETINEVIAKSAYVKLEEKRTAFHFESSSTDTFKSDKGGSRALIPVISEHMLVCENYLGVENVAQKFVDKIINLSVAKIQKHRKLRKEPILTEISLTSSEGTLISGATLSFGEETSQQTSYLTNVEIFGLFTSWPSVEEFTVDLGKDKLVEYMASWDYEENWFFCIDFKIAQSDESSDFYLYESKWSIPTKPYPIPQAYASIFFTIEASRVKPPQCLVDVTYVIEGSRMIHVPGKIPFQEKWLFDVIDSKILFYQRLRF